MPASGERQDDFSRLRAHWVKIMIGDANDMSDPDIAASVNATAASASKALANLNKQQERAYLWSDLTDFTKPATLTANFGRLKTMAAGYRQSGGAMRGNAELLRATLGGLDWMYAKHYNENTKMYGNWWDWQIGAPQALGEAALLLDEQLSRTQIENYIRVMDHFVPDASKSLYNNGRMTGANLTDQVLVALASGVLGKDAAKITRARDALSGVFPYVTQGDGFYADGSFIQHGHVPYTAGYGEVLLSGVARLLELFNDSAWPVADPAQSNVWNWVSQSYAPLLYDGAMMDMVGGRKISRCGRGDHGSGHGIVVSLLGLSHAAPKAQSAYLQQLIKAEATSDTTFSGDIDSCASGDADKPHAASRGGYYAGMAPAEIADFKALMKDPTIHAAAPARMSHTFASMARVVHQRPGFAYGISLFSKTITAYETGNGENLRPWYTGMGMTYLYNADQLQYNNNYWPTIDSVRLPGVTTDGATMDPPKEWALVANPNDWVGGSTLNELYSSTGMQFSASNVTGSTLHGKKSWFLFDNKIVALGADIGSASPGAVETIIENRKLNANGDNALIINGKPQPTTLGWSSNLDNVAWAYLDGNVVDSGIGYYFPGGTQLNALRESRTGKWSDIHSDKVGGHTPTTPHTNRFLSMAVPHGTKPSGGSYAYVVLPNQTAATMAAYAAKPDIRILSNTADLQAAYDAASQVTGANFWGGGQHVVYDTNHRPFLQTDTAASVTTQQNGKELDVAVSDPTQTNGTITLNISRIGASVISADPQVKVAQTRPDIRLVVDVKGAAGKSFSAKLMLGDSSGPGAKKR